VPEKPTTRQIALQMVKADPTVSATAIAGKAGVSRERVRQLLEEEGYQLEWRKKRKG
jgi:predicted ArsR family transcriptional regulator